MWIAVVGLGLIAIGIIKDRQDKKAKAYIPIKVKDNKRSRSN